MVLAASPSELGTNFTGTHPLCSDASKAALSLSYHHVFALREVPLHRTLLQCTPGYTTRVKSLSSPGLLLQPVIRKVC